MLGKDSSKIKPEEAETIIGTGVRVEGTFSAVGNVIVKGQLVGSLETESDVAVRESGVIEANLKAKNSSIAGEIKGNLDVVEKIELASTAKVLGDINCRVLAIEEGAILNGRCRVGGEGLGDYKEKKGKNEEKDKEDDED
jgi:cytoskeletal protein CcmA (bactofilin family)